MKTPSDKILRQHLIKLLEGSDAHVNFEAAIKDLPASLRGRRPEGAMHSPWEVVEHMRLALWGHPGVLAEPQTQVARVARRVLAQNESTP